MAQEKKKTTTKTTKKATTTKVKNDKIVSLTTTEEALKEYVDKKLDRVWGAIKKLCYVLVGVYAFLILLLFIMLLG